MYGVLSEGKKYFSLPKYLQYSVFFLENIFRGVETKFSRNEGGQAKIHKIYVVHTVSTCTSFSMLESDRACPCVN